MKKILVLLLFICFVNHLSAQQESTFERAEDAYFSFEYEEAKALYITLLVEGDDEWNYFIYYRLAYCYYGLDRMDEALKIGRKALGINSGNKDYKEIKGRCFWLIADIYSERGMPEKALEYMNYAAKILNDSNVWNNIGYSQLKLKQYAGALESYNQALVLDIENAYALSNRSFAYLKLGQIEQAQVDLKKSIELDPNNPYTYKYQALIYLELKEINKACEALRKAKELGYENFNYGRAIDAQEVNDLLKKHCVDSK